MKKITNILLYILMTAYLIILLYLTLFSRTGPSVRNINLIPFDSIQQDIIVGDGIRVALNMWGNILMFFPLGIYIMNFSNKKTLLSNIGIVAAFSLFIEIIQYIFAIGRSDIDDIILNTVGGLIGIIFYKILYKMLKNSDTVKIVITILSLMVGAPIIYLMLFHFKIRF